MLFPILIEVTKEDIIEAQQFRNTENGDCPFGRAIKRCFPNCLISVGRISVSVNHKTYLFPEFVSQRIEAFDSGKQIDPFNFVLDKEI